MIKLNILSSIFNDIILFFSKEETYYKCPKCNSNINYHQNACDNCKENLKW